MSKTLKRVLIAIAALGASARLVADKIIAGLD